MLEIQNPKKKNKDFFKDCKMQIGNKNDNIHKKEVQLIRWSDKYLQFRVATSITEYQNNLPKFMEKKQLFHVKNVCKNVKNQQV